MTLPFLSINIETTDWCNRKCSFCPNSLIDKEPEFMPRGLYEKILAELAEHNYSGRIHLYQRGEPLLDERLPGWTAMARKACPGSHLYISTNGDHLTRDLAKSLFRAGMNEIEVSHYDGMREELVRETSDFYGLVLHFDKRRDGNWHWFNRAGLVDVPSSMGTMDGGLCWWIFRKAGITCRGDYQLCCADWFPGKLGNIKDSTLMDLWNGKLLWDYRMAHTEKRGKTMPLCDKCNLMEG